MKGLTSRSKFQSYLYKTKKQNKNFNRTTILVSPELDRGNCLPLSIAPPSLSCESEDQFRDEKKKRYYSIYKIQYY